MLFSSIFTSFLVMGVCLTPHIHAQTRPEEPQQAEDPEEPDFHISPIEPRIGMLEIFQIARNGHSQCSTADSMRLQAQHPNMHRAIELASFQLPARDPALSPRTKSALALLFNVPLVRGSRAPTQEPRAFVSRTFVFGRSYLERTRKVARVGNAEIDLKTLILCGSLDVVLKDPGDPVPWASHRDTIGNLYGADDQDQYIYLYVVSEQAIGRVLKEKLPPVRFPAVPPRILGEPFPRYPPPVLYEFGPSFCASPDSQSWSFTLTKFAKDPHETTSLSKGVIILCPRALEERQATHPHELLPDQIDLSHQAVGTPLDDMKPAWFAWACALLQLATTPGLDTDQLIPAKVEYYHVPARPFRPHLLRKKLFTTEDWIATTATECMLLSLWQDSTPVSRSLEPDLTPSVYNPASLVWFAVVVYLQQVPWAAQFWGNGAAEDLPDPVCPDFGDGDDGGEGDDGGDGGGGGEGSGSRKRPHADEGSGSGSGSGGERPRIEPRDDDPDCDDDQSGDGGAQGGRIEL